MKKAICIALILAVAQVSAARASTVKNDIEKKVIKDGTTVTPEFENAVHTFDTIRFSTPIMLMKGQKLKLSIDFGKIDLFSSKVKLHSLKLDRGTKDSHKESLKMTIKGTNVKTFAWDLNYKLRDTTIGRYDRGTQILAPDTTKYVRDKKDLQLEGMGELNIGMLILGITNKDAAKMSISTIDIALDATSISKDNTQPIFVAPLPAPGLMLASVLGLGWVARRLRRAPARGARTPGTFSAGAGRVPLPEQA